MSGTRRARTGEGHVRQSIADSHHTPLVKSSYPAIIASPAVMLAARLNASYGYPAAAFRNASHS
jgi:hypothetical protein